VSPITSLGDRRAQHVAQQRLAPRREITISRSNALEGGEQTLGRLAVYVMELTGGREVAVRKLVMWNLETLDGCFDGPQLWQLDWHLTAWGDELERFSLDQSREVGTLLFGRVTYEGMAAHWTKATGDIAAFMNSVPKVVFSNTLESVGWSNTRLVKGDAADEVAKLKQESGKGTTVHWPRTTVHWPSTTARAKNGPWKPASPSLWYAGLPFLPRVADGTPHY
jgi:hypothetical protein